jgi:hypothetical protein
MAGFEVTINGRIWVTTEGRMLILVSSKFWLPQHWPNAASSASQLFQL